MAYAAKPELPAVFDVLCLLVFMILQSSQHPVLFIKRFIRTRILRITSVATLLAQGLLNAPAIAAGLMAFVAALTFRPPLPHGAVRSSFSYQFAPSRAPPRS